MSRLHLHDVRLVQQPNDKRSALERILSIVAEVRPGEGRLVSLVALNLFVLLTAYYAMKPVREALILSHGSGAEYRSYLGGIIAVALMIVVPLYGRLVNRLRRDHVTIVVTLFFALELPIFYVASRITLNSPFLGFAFYVWMGVFNMMSVAQLWALAADLYSEEQGRRLFPIIGLGSAAGGVIGSEIASTLMAPIGVITLLLVAAVLLGMSALLTYGIIKHARTVRHRDDATTPDAELSSVVHDKRGAFQLILAHPYLAFIAAFSLVFTCIKSNGEYMLSRLVRESTMALVDAGQITADHVSAHIGATYGRFYFWVNLTGLVLQLFFVSRVIKRFGFTRAFYVMPLVVLGESSMVALFPLLAVLRIGQTIENATDYSLNNTMRGMLWLPTTPAVKYKAKQACDTIFVRLGDVLSALLVLVGAHALGCGLRWFAAANLLLGGTWVVLAYHISQRRERLIQDNTSRSLQAITDQAVPP